MKYSLFILITALLAGSAASQSIRVNPTGVNVNSQSATVAFLTFGPVPTNYRAAEGVWCGQLIPAAAPALGLQCRPGTIYGVLPTRSDLSQGSGFGGFTDIMSIPASVARRAYQTAESGGSAGFFYVRHFVSTNGQPDQFVNVTCRMSSGGARVPFALTDVQLETGLKDPILFLKSGETLPVTTADIRYNGTGRLKGRWELVQPGQEMPSEEDLLTEASLPLEKRQAQRRYTQVGQFNHFLPPTGRFLLKLENPEKLPLSADGQYLLLLRIEAVDDKEGDSNLAAVGVGLGVAHNGAVAGFPMPTLKFFVTGGAKAGWETNGLLLPGVEADLSNSAIVQTFSWRELPEASMYRLEFVDSSGSAVFSALLPSTTTAYRPPSWLHQRYGPRLFGWRVTSYDAIGAVLSSTAVRTLNGR